MEKTFGLNTHILFHGTDGRNAASIIDNGLRVSQNGRIGIGVYFTQDKNVALAVGRLRGLQFVMTCEVDVGKVYDFDNDGQDVRWAWKGYDSAQAIHPSWAGCQPFREICVFDPSRVKITYVEGIVSVLPSSPGENYYIINVAHDAFLDSHGANTWLWGKASSNDIGGNPAAITWQLRPVGPKNTFYIINLAHKKFLCSHGGDTWLWGDSDSVDHGDNQVRWEFQPVENSPDTFYIVNLHHQKYLDSHGDKTWLWGDAKSGYHGGNPKAIQWIRKKV